MPGWKAGVTLLVAEHRRFASASSAGSAGLTVLQVVFLIVGIAAFVWLVNIVALNGDLLPDLSERLTTGTWVAILVPVIAVVFLVELLLFFFQRS